MLSSAALMASSSGKKAPSFSEKLDRTFRWTNERESNTCSILGGRADRCRIDCEECHTLQSGCRRKKGEVMDVRTQTVARMTIATDAAVVTGEIDLDGSTFVLVIS